MSNKAIQCLQKQNDGIYSSLIAKNIQFNRTIIPNEISDEEYIKLLSDENNILKELVKANKPISLPKEEKKQDILKKEDKIKPKEKKEDIDKDKETFEDEETFEEPIKKFETIINMEDMKRAFFNGDYDVFYNIFNTQPFIIYKMNYKYNSDKDGAPDFSAKNLLKGFVRNFDDYRKYFMICFRCWKHEDKNEYKYESYWIVNTNEPIQNIIGSIWEDFEVDISTDSGNFIESIKKLPESDENISTNGYICIGESYVH